MMKLALTLEADSVNVQALNMGRIVGKRAVRTVLTK